MVVSIGLTLLILSTFQSGQTWSNLEWISKGNHEAAKDVVVLQQEMEKVQNEFSQLESKWDTKMDVQFQGFKEDFQMEMCSLFEKYLGNTTASNTTTTTQAKGKGVLEGPPRRLPAKDGSNVPP
ncbi:hypothetical protein PVK06_034746 [Gossypium arboreum]|uniref:Uncharacterized protein n=1 Tax=Gossypium arboreum TaxID=29729 RepID=A0ABR0NH59_GOSAR|nr:hypothetical protein PVK06_034746 [Gossypium arboreum]